MKARVSIIAAIGKNRELGKAGELIWRIKEDLQRVRKLTTGHPLIMGRKTYESIGRPLPKRTNIVVSREGKSISGCEVFTTFEDALFFGHHIETEEIFIFGGAQIYTNALSFTDRLYLTCIDAEDVDADVFFPEYEKGFTKKISEEVREENGLTYRWVILERP